MTHQISEATGIPQSTVSDISTGETPRTPSKRQKGTGVLITTPDRERLVALATESAFNRRRPLSEIAELAGITACARTLRTTFARMGYHRRIARIKPFLTQPAKDKRLEWALAHADWTVADWSTVIWTDECALKVGEVSGNVWVTRLPGEEYHEDCLQPKFRKRPTVMIWGSMIGEELGPMVIWDSDEWGKITSKSYTEDILEEEIAPFYQEKEAELGRVYLMEDGASPHRARHTQNARERHGILSLPWPASSLDLNPIETLWFLIKSHITRLPLDQRPTTVDGMKTCIQRTWNYLHDHPSIRDLVPSMPARIQAVIAANGGHTRY